MKARTTAILAAAAMLVAWSCEEIIGPSPNSTGDEIVIGVESTDFTTRSAGSGSGTQVTEHDFGEGLSISVEAVPYGEETATRAAALTSLPSSLYWEGTTGTFRSETAKWSSASASLSSGKISTGKYQTSRPTAYNFYVANTPIDFASGGSTISVVNTADVIAGCTSAATPSATPSIALGHVFARTGSFTMNTQEGFTVSQVSWKLESISGGTSGTYNIATKGWSGVTALARTTVTSSSDLYLVPGTYRLHVGYTLTANGQSKSFTKSGEITLSAGKVNNITATASGGTIEYSLEVTPATASVHMGATTGLKATYYTITNGVRNAGTDVTSSAAWSSSATSVASVSAGKVTGKAKGTADITATYSGLSARANVTVTSPYTTELTSGTTYYFENSEMYGNANYYSYNGWSQITVTLKNAVDSTSTDVTSSCTFTKPSGTDFFDISPTGMITSSLNPRDELDIPGPGQGVSVTHTGTAKVSYTDPSGKKWEWTITIEVTLAIDNETDYF